MNCVLCQVKLELMMQIFMFPLFLQALDFFLRASVNLPGLCVRSLKLHVVFQDYRDAQRVTIQGQVTLKLRTNKPTINIQHQSLLVNKKKKKRCGSAP